MSIRPPITEPHLCSRARILIAGDSLEVRRRVSAALPPEYEVLEVGVDGLRTFPPPAPQVIVLEIAIVGIAGLQPLRICRSQPVFSRTGIMLLTEDARRHVVLAALRGGANDYLLKTHFAADNFLRRVDRLLDRVYGGEQFPVIMDEDGCGDGVSNRTVVETEPAAPASESITVNPQDLQAIIDSWE